MNIVTTPLVIDPIAILKTARRWAGHDDKLRAHLIAASGPWLSRKLNDPDARLSDHEALQVKRAISSCDLASLPKPEATNAVPPRKKNRPKPKTTPAVTEVPAIPQRAVRDAHFMELLRLAHYKGKEFGRVLQAELTPKARRLAIHAIVAREGIHAQGTFTRLLSNQLEWTETYLHDVIQAMGLSAQELLFLTKRFVKV